MGTSLFPPIFIGLGPSHAATALSEFFEDLPFQLHCFGGARSLEDHLARQLETRVPLAELPLLIVSDGPLDEGLLNTELRKQLNIPLLLVSHPTQQAGSSDEAGSSNEIVSPDAPAEELCRRASALLLSAMSLRWPVPCGPGPLAPVAAS